MLAAASCVVTAESVPQAEPLQPAPLTVQVRSSLGFEPGTGVKVATMAALPLAATLAGADMVNVKLLVTVMEADADFDGSATLWAVSVTPASAGRICGAVKFPWASTAPHWFGHAAPERLQCSDVSGCPALVMLAANACSAPSSTLATFGAI